ncbi:SAM-dependent methyltransferase [Spiractinospora alimapuensis]|nr:SAM-dependent methyltransferase [Spiractinospora alimapuensis]
MKQAAREYDPSGYPPDIPTDRPTASRAYGWLLGGKDNFQVDRDFIMNLEKRFPECLDIARQNRMFLYRAVRYLARDVGIRQFLDLGSGYPTTNNVHQVAQLFQPDARVVYVDIDPIVLTHGRALLADNPNTTVITADITDPDAVLNHPDVTRLIDPAEPLGILLFSIPHCIPDSDGAYRALRHPIDRAAPGSHMAMSHVVADDQATADDLTSVITSLGMPWCTRTSATVTQWLEGLEPVEPGLVDISTWRPDPDQPALPDVADELKQYLGAGSQSKKVYEFGGVLRK